VQQIMTDRGS